ncbi:MAG TPA: hypothetical protein VJW73_23595 [Gemmatimonadaceae bacterium]|nr:hypothetical protein [Gemmatimonadaceae bacterium]
MRSLLGGWSPAIVSVCVAVELLACPRVASPQAKDSATGPAPVARQASLASRHQTLATSSGDVALDRRASDRLQSAQQVLFDGRYADAMSAFTAVLESGDARGNYSLTSWAQHGMAIAAAFDGQVAKARSLYDELLRGPMLFPLADSIEAAVLTKRHAQATALLDRFTTSHPSALGQQYAHSFRALDLLFAGSCDAALAEVTRAPDVDRPLPQAIRGFCAAKADRHAEAVALRDSVLTQPLADPNSWPMIVARGVALRIR